MAQEKQKNCVSLIFTFFFVTLPKDTNYQP